MPFDDTDSGKTHYYGCWRDPTHHECAVRLIERAIVLLDEATLAEAPYKRDQWLRDVGEQE